MASMPTKPPKAVPSNAAPVVGDSLKEEGSVMARFKALAAAKNGDAPVATSSLPVTTAAPVPASRPVTAASTSTTAAKSSPAPPPPPPPQPKKSVTAPTITPPATTSTENAAVIASSPSVAPPAVSTKPTKLNPPPKPLNPKSGAAATMAATLAATSPTSPGASTSASNLFTTSSSAGAAAASPTSSSESAASLSSPTTSNGNTPKGSKSTISMAFDRMSMASTSSAASSAAGDFDESDVIRRGALHKIGKDGGVDACQFVLTSKDVHYHVTGGSTLLEAVSVQVAGGMKFKSIPLAGVVVKQGDTEDSFILFSKVKTFIVRCESNTECQGWMHDIAQAARAVQTEELGRVLTENETLPVFAFKQDVNHCQVCNKGFGFLSRRHHCRNCGKCVCDECSREKVRIPRLEERTLYKVCNDCARELKNNRVYGAQRQQQQEESSA